MRIDPASGERKALVLVLIEFPWCETLRQIVAIEHPEGVIEEKRGQNGSVENITNITES